MRTFGAILAVLLLTIPLAQGIPDYLGSVEDVAEDLPNPLEAGEDWAYSHIAPGLADAEVTGVLQITGTATVLQGYRIHRIGIWVDSWFMGYANGTTEWSYTLDTRLLVDGPHVFKTAAYAAPDVIIFPVLVGAGESVRFKTLNLAPAVTLFEEKAEFTGVHTGAWLVPLDQDYVGLRVTITAVGDDPRLVPESQVVVGYKETEDETQPPLRTWLATYGRLGASASISRPPHPVMEAPGVLVVTGLFVGEGLAHIKIEAIPLRTL